MNNDSNYTEFEEYAFYLRWHCGLNWSQIGRLMGMTGTGAQALLMKALLLNEMLR